MAPAASGYPVSTVTPAIPMYTGPPFEASAVIVTPLLGRSVLLVRGTAVLPIPVFAPWAVAPDIINPYLAGGLSHIGEHCKLSPLRRREYAGRFELTIPEQCMHRVERGHH